MAGGDHACMLCGGSLRHWMTVHGDHRRPQDRRQYELYWCDACRLGQLHPRPTQVEADAFYEIRYCTHARDEKAASTSDHYTFWEKARMRVAWAFDRGSHIDADLIQGLVRGAPSSICDMGCGNGGLLAALRARGHRVVGVEPDPVARQLALERGLAVHAGHADAPPAQVASDRFDLVIMNHVLHLCLDPLRVLENARKLLRSDGLLVCEVTNNEATGLHQSGDCWRWLDIPRHLTLFTSGSLSRACASVGLEVKGVHFGGYTRQFRREWLEDEAQKRAILYPSRRGSPAMQSVRSWELLARTALARPEKKYDSVRVIAGPAPGS